MRNRLRTETSVIHQQLDDFVSSLKPFESISAYQVYLTAMHQLYSIYGQPLDRASRWAALEESSTDLVAAIVSDLGHVPLTKDQSGRSDWTDHEVWATAYVLEGSAMGARYIVKTLSKSEASLPHQYLLKLASDSYERWPRIVSCLDSADCDVEQTVVAARAIFNTAYETFQSLASNLSASNKS